MKSFSSPNSLPTLPNADATSKPAAAEDCVPLSALAMPDSENGDQMASPEVGDKVTYSIDGTVTRIEGSNAYVKRDSVNGEPVDEKADSEDAGDQSSESSDGSALRDEAQGMGGMS